MKVLSEVTGSEDYRRSRLQTSASPALPCCHPAALAPLLHGLASHTPHPEALSNSTLDSAALHVKEALNPLAALH